MYITIEARVSKDKYSYRDNTGKAEITFEIEDDGVGYIINTLGALMQATANQALRNYLHPQPKDE